MAKSQGVQQNGREQHEGDPIAPEPHRWRDSDAQKLLRQLLATGMIPESGMKPKDIWDNICSSRPEFAGFISKSSLHGFVQQGSRVFRRGHELSVRMLHLSTIGCSFRPQRIINEASHGGMARRQKASSSMTLPRKGTRKWPLSCFVKRELNTWSSHLTCLESIHQVRLRKLIFQYQTNRG
ncbi:hypothetical protein MHU86_9815 [Fragilaria crotonensis]|nr:hypothetical protein MHU86_9815 [Fragilaria crotonensis]